MDFSLTLYNISPTLKKNVKCDISFAFLFTVVPSSFRKAADRENHNLSNHAYVFRPTVSPAESSNERSSNLSYSPLLSLSN